MKQFELTGLSAFSFDLEGFEGTSLFFCHSRRAWRNAVQVKIISGNGI